VSPNPYLYTVVILALSTGIRQAEAMSLKYANVCLKKGKITLYETKNGEIQVVP
jgi:integrase